MQPSNRTRVAIESPYAGAVEKNTVFARRVCRYAYEQGKNPFAMHLFFPQFLDEENTAERTAGIECGLAWTQYAEEVWFCVRPGERLTKGMLKALTRLSGLPKPPALRYLRFSVEGDFLEELAQGDVV